MLSYLNYENKKTRRTFETDQVSTLRTCYFSYFFEAHHRLELSAILKHSKAFIVIDYQLCFPHFLECLFSTIKLLVILQDPNKILFLLWSIHKVLQNIFSFHSLCSERILPLRHTQCLYIIEPLYIMIICWFIYLCSFLNINSMRVGAMTHLSLN